jgi:hypothetical protein
MMTWRNAIARFFGLTATGDEIKAPITRLSVLSSGRILVNGRTASAADVAQALEQTKARRGSVWFYRESTGAEPPSEAVVVFKMIVDHKVPVSLSTKPDFSDFVDEQGRAEPKK